MRNNWRRISFKEEWNEKGGEGWEDHVYKAWRCEQREDKSVTRFAYTTNQEVDFTVTPTFELKTANGKESEEVI